MKQLFTCSLGREGGSSLLYPIFGCCWVVLLSTDTALQSAPGLWDITVGNKVCESYMVLQQQQRLNSIHIPLGMG